jgi:hypothetical protein
VDAIQATAKDHEALLGPEVMEPLAEVVAPAEPEGTRAPRSRTRS